MAPGRSPRWPGCPQLSRPASREPGLPFPCLSSAPVTRVPRDDRCHGDRTTPAHATDGIVGYAICHAGPGTAPVYRTTTSPWTRIYTIPVNGAMHVDKFVRINGVTLAYGHGFNKPNGWTNAHNFNRCIA